MRFTVTVAAAIMCFALSASPAASGDTFAAAKNSVSSVTSVDKKDNAAKPRADEAPRSASESKPAATPGSFPDTLVIIARLIEIPGKFAPNDLYNYVYVMKYRIVKVIKGSYKDQEVLVGHYNPLIPRKQIRDKMSKFVAGDVTRFKAGDLHKLVLIRPIERIWKDDVEDEYFDSDLDKYFALKAEIAR